MRGRKNATIAIARPFSRPCPVVCSDYIYKLQLLTRHTAAISMRTKMSTLMAIVFVLVLAQLCQGNRQIEILDGSIPSTIIFAHFDPSHPLTVQRILSSRTGASWMAGNTAMVFENGHPGQNLVVLRFNANKWYPSSEKPYEIERSKKPSLCRT